MSPRYDVPRNSQNVALIADPRNDENLIVSQLQLALLRFHNAVLADVKSDLGSSYTLEEIFAETQRIVRWHYQWMIVHEFLPATIGASLTDDILTHGRTFYGWRNAPYIPIEFSVAAYRFGHSQVRPSYRGNFGTDAADAAQQFFALFFKPGDPNPADPDDLRGGCRASRRFVDWQTFFDFGDGRARPNKLIDTTLSSILFHLMGQATGTPDSLATRNLAARADDEGAVGSVGGQGDDPAPTRPRGPRGPRPPPPGEADSPVVLHPSRGRRAGRRPAPRRRRRAHRRGGHPRPPPG